MTSLDCSRCKRKTSAGNCPNPLDDGHPVQCVGEWADNEKHDYFRRYIEATREVRRGYDQSTGFVDLFAGPGRVRLRDSGEVRDGSPLIALVHDEVPFGKVALCDLSPENVVALRARTAQYGERVRVVSGDANAQIEQLIAHLPFHGLNLALIDPFGLSPLRFSTIRALGRLPRMDLIINFPTSDIRRNFSLYWDQGDERIARVLGFDDWRAELSPGGPNPELAILSLFLRQLESLGYTGAETRFPVVSNSRNGELYRLVFASKHLLGDKIWNSIARNPPSGQTSFSF